MDRLFQRHLYVADRLARQLPFQCPRRHWGSDSHRGPSGFPIKQGFQNSQELPWRSPVPPNRWIQCRHSKCPELPLP